ncbi:hypothetical protein K2173_023768 [Erythroxylum novogranatense]|uniref:Uncharacterized protein n=1 Tax=Erythroxylum novogranatense TaxID=1862640 RepID=A0AAV8TI36_9ROSI|nr:hypothetical protein K2173_023768 [Erythroxylum novogranatense]
MLGTRNKLGQLHGYNFNKGCLRFCVWTFIGVSILNSKVEAETEHETGSVYFQGFQISKNGPVFPFNAKEIGSELGMLCWWNGLVRLWKSSVLRQHCSSTSSNQGSK